MPRALVLLGLLWGGAGLGACSFGAAGVEVQTLYVDARTVPCVGEGVRTCLRVKRSPEAE